MPFFASKRTLAPYPQSKGPTARRLVAIPVGPRKAPRILVLACAVWAGHSWTMTANLPSHPGRENNC